MKSINNEIAELLKQLRKLLAKKALNAQEIELCQQIHANIKRLTRIKQFLDDNGFSHVNHVLGARTPLNVAISQNNYEIFDLLIAHPKIKINLVNNVGQNAVWSSANQGKLPFLRKLANTKANFSQPDTGGKTPLFTAIQNKFYNAAAFIMHKITGFSIYDNEPYGKHPIHALATRRCSENDMNKLLQCFKKNHIDLNSRNLNMHTPLMTAALDGNIVAIKQLIINGADICLVDRDGDTFLELLDDEHHDEILNFMREHHYNADWFKDVRIVKEYGHVLGIGTFLKLGKKLGLGGIINVPLGLNGKTVPVYTEAWHQKESYKTLHEEVGKYIDSEQLQNSDFNKIYDALASATILDHGNRHRYKEYNDGKPIIIKVKLAGHGVGLALYKDKLIYTDRFITSGKKINECTKIFQLNNQSQAAISDILNFFTREQTEDDIEAKFREYVDFDHPLLETGDKLQAHGTCTYSNPRSNIEGILCVMQADRLNRTINDCKQSARNAYRDFLYKGRFKKSQDLMDDLQNAENAGLTAKANMYFDIAESYIRGHRSGKKNDGSDRNNVLEIYQRLPPRLRQIFDKRNRIMAYKLRKHLLYNRVNHLLLKCSKPSTNILLNEILQQIKLQEATGKSPDLNEAILSTYQLAIEAGHRSVLKEASQLLKLFAQDESLPEINFEYIFNKINNPLLPSYRSTQSKAETMIEQKEYHAKQKPISISPLILKKQALFNANNKPTSSVPTLEELKAAALKRKIFRDNPSK